ncbi:MAG: MMPL family transporter, partial [Bdellovibrionales bacterium]|nr:MMPL family transporter [Bdellovibrionales bacterium]
MVSDPTIYPLLISKNFDTAVLAITSSMARSEIIGLLDEIRLKVENKFEKAKVKMGGVPTIQAQMAQLIGEELRLFLLLALLVSCLSLFFVFSSLSSLLIPVIAVLLSVILSVEFMVLANLSFNALSATVMVLVMIIVVALCIHTQLRFSKEFKNKNDKKEALNETFKKLFLPNLLTALTTAVGFITLYFSPATLMRQYGLSVAVSVFIAWFVTSSFLFGFLSILPLPKARSWVFAQTNKLSFAVDRRKTIILKVFLLSILSLLASFNISWDARLFDDLPDNHEARKVSNIIDKELGGLMTFDVAVSSEEEGYWNEPEAMKKIDALEKRWRQLELVESVLSVPELIRQSKNKPQMTIPDERSQIAEIGFMFSLAETNPLIHYLTPDSSGIRIALRLQDAPANQLRYVQEQIVNDLKSSFPSLEVSKGGMASYAHQLSQFLSRELIQGFWWAMLAICFVLFFVFRSLTWTILATAPNFLPAIALLGLLGFSQLPIKPAIATIFSIALGIAFDNTVYILSRLRSYNSPLGQKLVKKAIQEEGISCFISSFCLFCGFAIFLMSYFSINRFFGMFLLFSILVGLVGDLLFLPA